MKSKFPKTCKSVEDLYASDEIRTSLIRKNYFNEAWTSYSKQHIDEIKNINSDKFWTELLKKNTTETQNDPMRDDRLISAASLINKLGKSSLNIGVGDGYLENRILSRKNNHYGVDITFDRLNNLTSTHRFNRIVADARYLPFKSSFDTIFILEVLEHFHFKDSIKILKSINSLLSKKGILVISVPVNENYTSKYNPNGHYRRYSPELIRFELKNTGFSILTEKQLYAFNSFYKLKSKLLPKILPNKYKPNVVLISATKK